MLSHQVELNDGIFITTQQNHKNRWKQRWKPFSWQKSESPCTCLTWCNGCNCRFSWAAWFVPATFAMFDYVSQRRQTSFSTNLCSVETESINTFLHLSTDIFWHPAVHIHGVFGTGGKKFPVICEWRIIDSNSSLHSIIDLYIYNKCCK